MLFFTDSVESMARDLRRYYLTSYCRKQMYPWKPGNFVELDKIYISVNIDITIPGMRPIKERLKSYHEIFDNNGDTRYVLTGNPGQGKSTFCAKLAFDWCQESDSSPLKDVKLLFIIQLARVTHSSDIEDAIYSQLLSSNVDIDSNKAALDEVIRTLGEAVVIVLDGLDEAPPDLFKHEKTGNLVKVIQFKHFRECCVLVTTRPWREKEVTEIPGYRRLELQKMNRSDIKRYVKKLFGQNTDTIALGNRLLQYIDENRLLLDCSSPLMTLILSWYWLETNGERGIPDRISDMYEEIMTIMYDNYCQSTSSEVIIEKFSWLFYISVCFK